MDEVNEAVAVEARSVTREARHAASRLAELAGGSSEAWAKAFSKALPDELHDCDGPCVSLFFYLWAKARLQAAAVAAGSSEAGRLRKREEPRSLPGLGPTRAHTDGHAAALLAAGHGGVQAPAARVLVLHEQTDGRGALRSRVQPRRAADAFLLAHTALPDPAQEPEEPCEQQHRGGVHPAPGASSRVLR